MTTLLYVNHGKGEHCGVHDFGVRHFAAIKDSEKYTAVYAEIDSLTAFLELADELKPDVVMFNYMEMLLPWVSQRPQGGYKAVVVQHLYDPQSVGPIMNSYGSMFDYMVVLDPSLAPQPRIFPMARPIQRYDATPRPLRDHVQIGSFGFGMPHKQFHLVAREVNRCFDNATFNLHMTVGDFTGDYSQGIIESVNAELTKPGVTLNWTSDYRDETEIIEMLAQNDMNALFYSLPPDNAGLSSSVDYAVSAQRPLLVTDCASFKHVHHGTYQYPSVSFDTIAGNYEWCQNHSFELYERMVGKLQSDTEKFLEAIL